jgi:hypothetical protein
MIIVYMGRNVNVSLIMAAIQHAALCISTIGMALKVVVQYYQNKYMVDAVYVYMCRYPAKVWEQHSWHTVSDVWCLMSFTRFEAADVVHLEDLMVDA